MNAEIAEGLKGLARRSAPMRPYEKMTVFGDNGLTHTDF
jgi:hypothetical protein